MNWMENFNISISYSPVYFFLAIIIAIVYTVFIYRVTLPKINLLWKIILIFLRSLALLAVIILFFDPILSITSKEKIEPTNLIFLDNTKSIDQFSSGNDISELNRIPLLLKNNLDANTKFFILGNDTEFNPETDTLDFSGTSTDYDYMLKKLNDYKDISSAVVISDGIINQGENPLYDIREKPFPIYTIGIGDSTIKKDISIEQIRMNSTIYAERETEIEVLLKSFGLEDKIASISFYDNDSLFSTSQFTIGNTGIDRITIPYISAKEGVHTITVRINLNEEENKNNNIKSSIINVLSNKKKITLICGGLSPDYSAIKQALELNEDYTLNEIIEIGSKRYLDEGRDLNEIEKSDILFFIGFPSETSDISLITEVKRVLTNKKTPVFMSFSNNIDFKKLEQFREYIPFSWSRQSNRFIETEVVAENTFSNLIGNIDRVKLAWEQMPPISVRDVIFSSFVNSEIFLKAKSSNNPVIISKNAANGRGIYVTGTNIWRWKLKAPKREYQLFDNFIINSVKWLTLESEDYFNVKLNKRNFNIGEDANFIANLFNNTFEPLNNAEIDLEIVHNNEKRNFRFTSVGNGLYETDVQLSKSGLYNYTAKLVNNPRQLPPHNGTFSVNPMEIEMLESNLNKNLLVSIANETGGKYYYINKLDGLINQLNSNYRNNIYFNITDKELRLSSFEFILLVLVLLFSTEWVIRKVFRMI